MTEMEAKNHRHSNSQSPGGGHDPAGIGSLPLGRSVSGDAVGVASASSCRGSAKDLAGAPVADRAERQGDPLRVHRGRVTKPLLETRTSSGSSAASGSAPGGNPGIAPSRPSDSRAQVDQEENDADTHGHDLGRKSRQACSSEGKVAFSKGVDDLNGLSTGTAVSSTCTALSSSACSPDGWPKGGLPKHAGKSEGVVDVEDVDLVCDQLAGSNHHSGARQAEDSEHMGAPALGGDDNLPPILTNRGPGCGAVLAAAFSLFPASSSTAAASGAGGPLGVRRASSSMAAASGTGGPLGAHRTTSSTMQTIPHAAAGSRSSSSRRGTSSEARSTLAPGRTPPSPTPTPH